MRRPIHPGDVLLEVYLKHAFPPVTIGNLSRTLSVPQRQVAELIKAKQPMTRPMAQRLAVVFKTTPEYWMNLQRTYNAQRKQHQPSGATQRRQGQTRHPAAA